MGDSRGAYKITVELTRTQHARLLEIQRNVQYDAGKRAGVPVKVTLSALVQSWIGEKLGVRESEENGGSA